MDIHEALQSVHETNEPLRLFPDETDCVGALFPKLGLFFVKIEYFDDIIIPPHFFVESLLLGCESANPVS